MVNCRGAIIIKEIQRCSQQSAADVLSYGHDSSDGQSLSDGRFCRMAMLLYEAQKISIKLLEKRHSASALILSTWAEALGCLLLPSWIPLIMDSTKTTSGDGSLHDDCEFETLVLFLCAVRSYTSQKRLSGNDLYNK